MNPRLLKLQQLLRNKKLDAILVSSIPNITYLTGFSNFSKDEREAFLLITKKSNYIFTDGRYSEAVEKYVKGFKLIEISSSFSLADVLAKFAIEKKLRKIGIEEDNLTVTEYKKFRKIFKKLVNFNTSELRIIKSEHEISKIQKACQIGDLAYSHILKKLRINVTEKEIASEIELFIKGKGADISFEPIVAFGSNSSVPHHKSSNRKLKKGNIVLLDFGVKFENYCSDMTRTVFFGKPTRRQKEIYQTVLNAQKLAIEHIDLAGLKRPTCEVRASEVDKVARDYIISKGYKTIPHSLGHGIGLEVHEAPHLSPISKDELKEGMVFSIEPGIYIKNFGGVRIEDLALLTAKGAKLLTTSPKRFIA